MNSFGNLGSHLILNLTTQPKKKELKLIIATNMLKAQQLGSFFCF